jgi:hypothetical protein
MEALVPANTNVWQDINVSSVMVNGTKESSFPSQVISSSSIELSSIESFVKVEDLDGTIEESM